MSGLCTDLPGINAAQDLRPLFVLSVVRSGSTLLCTLLNQHSQIALFCEGDLPSLHHYLWGRLRTGAWRERWEFWNRGASRHGLAVESLPGCVSNVWEATQVAYQKVAQQKRAVIWGDKTHWCDGALRLAEKFPQSRFIFLWRDPHGVMEGIARGALTERYYRKAGLANRALLGTEKLRRACDRLKAQGRSVHEIYYEDLVAYPTESLQKICQFLELSFDPRMTSLEGADRSLIEGGDRLHHARLWYDAIATERKQNALVTPALRSKIDRYICYWRQQYRGGWPKHPLRLSEVDRTVGPVELWGDRLTYKALGFWDEVVKMIYAFLPLAVSRSYRNWSRRQTASGSVSPSESRAQYESNR